MVESMSRLEESGWHGPISTLLVTDCEGNHDKIIVTNKNTLTLIACHGWRSPSHNIYTYKFHNGFIPIEPDLEELYKFRERRENEIRGLSI